jgi:hypothetical protein
MIVILHEKTKKINYYREKELDSIQHTTYSLTRESGELFSYLPSPVPKK